jgi:hypothetical protein
MPHCSWIRASEGESSGEEVSEEPGGSGTGTLRVIVRAWALALREEGSKQSRDVISCGF